MIGYLLAGIVLGGGLVWILYFSARREIVKIEEEKQLLQQEKHIVIEFMHNLVEAIGEGLDRDELNQRIVHAAILSSGALSACLFEKTDENHLVSVAFEGLFPPLREIPDSEKESHTTRAEFIESIFKSESFEMGEGLIGSAAQSQKAILIKNAATDPRVPQHKDPALAFHSMIVAPILFRKNVMGVLAVANPVDAMPFTENDFSLAQSLAEQAGMAIHNSNVMSVLIEKNKLDFDLSLASNIQGMLLPNKFPQNTSLDIGAYYEPAQKVGGDLYDVFDLPDDRIGVAIADVSGKGVPASLLMAICQTNLRHYARQFDSPAKVLQAMNKEMIPEMRQDMFITIIYAIIDTKKNEITLARAGHELPLLLRYDEATQHSLPEKIASEGMALGMVPENLFNTVIADKVVAFNPKDIFVLYTDGITEATNEDSDEFSFGRLSKIVETTHNHTAERINQEIIESVQAFSPTIKPADDLTLVTVKFNSQST